MPVLAMLLFLLAQPSAHAHFADCESLLAAKPIARTLRRLHSIEIFEAGTVIPPERNLPLLETGFYVYLITRDGEIVFSPRYLLRDPKKNLVTHKSLLEAYATKTGKAVPPVIIAAGEFQVAFDDLVIIRNKSGNYRGDPASLALAIQRMTLRGLPFSKRTKVSPVVRGKSEDRGETPADRNIDDFRIEVLKAVHNSERGIWLLDLYRRMYFLLRETYPRYTGKDAIEALMNAQAAGAGFNGYYDGYQTFYSPLQSAFSTDGLEYGIWNVERQIDRGGHDSFDHGVPKQIENFIYGAQDNLSPLLIAKWKQLAKEFVGLEKIKN